MRWKRAARIGGVLLGSLALWIAVLAITVAVMRSRVPVGLPSYADVISVSSDIVMVEGTWVIDGDRIYDPLQTSSIHCERKLMRCTSSTASVSPERSLSTSLNLYDAVEWTTSRVVFVDELPSCVSYVYTIDLLTKSVNGVRKKREDSVLRGVDCSAVSTELRLAMRKGSDVAKELEDEAMPWYGQAAMLPFRAIYALRDSS